MKTTKILKLLSALTVVFAGTIPAYASDGVEEITDNVRIYEIDMNDQTPLDTLKRLVIEDRSVYDASVNLNTIDMDESIIYTNTFDRTHSGIQKISISISLVREDTDSVGYDFTTNAAVKMIKPEGPQVILKQSSVTMDLGGTFQYADNIGYVSSTNGKLPAIKEEDNVDVNTEGTYTCTMEFYDESGKKSTISYDVIVEKPAEVIRAEEEAAAEAQRLAEEQAAAEAAAQAAAEQAAQAVAQAQSISTSTTVDVSAYTGSGSDIVNYALTFVGCSYVWGGSTPAGFDCSGFTMYVFAAFGISLPHSSDSQAYYGTTISASEAQPGDLVTYSGHAAIYIGNGMIVHAMDPTHGVTITSMYGVSNGNMQIHRLS